MSNSLCTKTTRLLAVAAFMLPASIVVDPDACVGSIVSNGRIFHTSQGGGLQLSQVYGSEAASMTAVWERE